MCSEVNHERFDTGSDTVIHSAQIKTHLLLELPAVYLRGPTGTQCDTKQAHHDQSVFVNMF